MITVTVDYFQGYGTSFPDLESALRYAATELVKELQQAIRQNRAPWIEGITAEDDADNFFQLVADEEGEFRWALDGTP